MLHFACAFLCSFRLCNTWRRCACKITNLEKVGRTLLRFVERLVTNGDFETPPATGFPKDEALVEGATEIPGWKTNGTVELVSSGQKQGAMILIVPRGAHAVRLGNDAEISQELTVEKGSTYSVTFSAARTCAQLESLNVSVPPASQTIDLQTLYNVQGWDPYAWAFEAAEDKVRLVFTNPGMEDDPTCGPIIDDIAIKKLFIPDRPKGTIPLFPSLLNFLGHPPSPPPASARAF
ncbi:hypothetical protein OIU84_002682 [Salix udensis]|uniref:DUF642 domain-containing protein n=1 Tax=Salix udensis TaxID=889485 RepID=A0AAD6P5K8_9ROSI|nr:hypothetical protein OIU84_002682 [Salix udensis]